MVSFFTATIFASAAWGHMIMQQPVPYGVASLDNSPLGADFPCKQRSGVYEVSEMNNIVAGTDQALTFTGTAVHGGGSCQVSISKDREPTAQSVFKVIHSIVGGCPGVDGGPRDFSFQVPQEFPNGEYALAWTWFNKIGNREMYMNCAPVTITGGSDDDAFFDTLPNMFVANIPDSECTTPEGGDIVFPDGGDSVETDPAATLETSLPPACGAAAAPQPGSGADQETEQSSSQPAVPTVPSTSSPVAAPTVSVAPQPPFTNISQPAASAPATMSTITVPVAGDEQQTVPASSQVSSVVSAPSPSAPSGDAGGCGENGAIVCNGGDQFGICNHGSVVWQAVAPGTACQGGAIVKRNMLSRPHVR